MGLMIAIFLNFRYNLLAVRGFHSLIDIIFDYQAYVLLVPNRRSNCNLAYRSIVS